MVQLKSIGYNEAVSVCEETFRESQSLMEKILSHSFENVDSELCVKDAVGGAMAFLDPYIEACRQRAAFYEVELGHIWEVSKKEAYRGCISGDAQVLLLSPTTATDSDTCNASQYTYRAVHNIRPGDVVLCRLAVINDNVVGVLKLTDSQAASVHCCHQY